MYTIAKTKELNTKYPLTHVYNDSNLSPYLVMYTIAKTKKLNTKYPLTHLLFCFSVSRYIKELCLYHFSDVTCVLS